MAVRILILIGAFLSSMMLALALVVAVEVWSAVVHPLPPDFDQSMDAMCRHVSRYPAWVLAAVVPLWSGIAYVSCGMARRLGSVLVGWLVGILLVAAVVWNVSMLPYPIWFKGIMGVVMPVTVYLALRVRTAGADDVSHETPREVIGFFALATLSYSLKFVWAPLIDRLARPRPPAALPLAHLAGRGLRPLPAVLRPTNSAAGWLKCDSHPAPAADPGPQSGCGREIPAVFVRIRTRAECSRPLEWNIPARWLDRPHTPPIPLPSPALLWTTARAAVRG